MATRKELVEQVRELTARLGAAAGETRKNLRERVTRLAAENEQLQAQLKQAQRDSADLLNRYEQLKEDLRAAKENERISRQDHETTRGELDAALGRQ